MINDQIKTTGFILSSVSLGFNTFACLISCIVFLIIIYHLYYNHVKRDDKITVVLCAHIYLTILTCSSMLSSMNIRSMLGDLYNQSFDSSWCIFSGYLSSILLGMLYWNFFNQAFYRLIRIVYSQNRRLQSLKLYVILPFIELIIVTSIVLCILLPLNGFIMPFKERTWFLTILDIKCMEIEFGESEPRSVLILQYNNESTTVQL
ncbi:unnamed protein product [Adineta steineri]|uniref:G-protein coupled receptors family 1 profile domain-containing protein n=1 Tax=Adineta steineri TaxID=433720 RepID=A0A815AJ75_9BILA|nr:unnamed protein product [Adineta steineri]